MGDNGRVTFTEGVRTRVETLDTIGSTGGNDDISLGDGEDQALGGVGADTIENASGETVMIGDDGYVDSDAAGRYVEGATGSTVLGDDDLLIGGSDRDVLFGGSIMM